MAQVCGGTTFDFVAERKHETALKALSRAADLWATCGRDSLSVDSLIAVLLSVFFTRLGSSVSEETRDLDSWLSLVTSAKVLAEKSFPTIDPATIAKILAELETEIGNAVEQWSLGNPEQPPTAHVLNSVEHILFVHKLRHRPPNPKMPNTLLR
jgi:hypothetical protein